MDNFEQQILDYLSQDDYVPAKAKKLAGRIGVREEDRPKFFESLDQLIAGGKIREGRKGKLRLVSATGLIAGILKRVSSGAGYVIPHEPNPELNGMDIYIQPFDMGDAHTGDEVLVQLLKRRVGGGKRCGRIEEILVRTTRSFVGTYFERDGQSYVKVDGTQIAEPVIVDDPGAKGARPDDKVVIEMLRFPTNYSPGEAVLTKVLGPRGKIGVDTLSIIHEFALPHEFDEDVLSAARKQAEEFDESDLKGRRDLTNETIITIDPVDARDFDDAISLSRDDKGHWHLGVHIADVSHFVQQGSSLDVEARKRGTSVYLPRHVIPMLPEVISNGLASLQQGKVRYTKTAFIEFTPDGAPVATDFVNSAIKVTRRFVYEEVMPIIQDPEKHKAKVSAKVRQLLAHMYELAMILRARRYTKGALELSLPEVQIDFDKNGSVTGAHRSVHDESHQIIEEFMLAANIAVATEFADRRLPFLRRVHGDPDLLKLQQFSEFAKALGFNIKNPQSRPELQKLLERVKGQPVERAVNYSLLRSMKQAEYTAAELGHYALSAENYCHFTSPIRRYPDLTIHRLFDMVLASRERPKHGDVSELMKLGKHCSITERRAAAAERELTKVKLLMAMTSRVGEELDAIITGVEHFGIFCQGIEIPVDGLIHVTALPRDDFYDHDPASISLIGRRTGKEFRLGDPIRVVVGLVDVDRRVLDFRIVDSTDRRSGSSKPDKPSKDGKKPRAGTHRFEEKRDRESGSRDTGGRKRRKSRGVSTGPKKKRGNGRKRRR